MTEKVICLGPSIVNGLSMLSVFLSNIYNWLEMWLDQEIDVNKFSLFLEKWMIFDDILFFRGVQNSKKHLGEFLIFFSPLLNLETWFCPL